MTTAPRPASFDKRLVEHLPLLERLAVRYCHRNEREEVVQEAFASALDKWELFRPEGSFSQWLRFRFWAAADKRLYSRKRDFKHFVQGDDLLDTQSTPAAQENITLANQVVRRLSRSRGGRMLLRLARGENLEDIGKRHGLCRERVRQITLEARETLVKQMEKPRRKKVAA